MKTLLIFGCATVVASAFGPATTAGAQNDRYREKFDTAVTMGRGGSVRISVYSGHVNVVGVSGSRVRVRGFVDRGEFKFAARVLAG